MQHTSKLGSNVLKDCDPEFQVVNQNKSKVMMPVSFLNNQSVGTVFKTLFRANHFY